MVEVPGDEEGEEGEERPLHEVAPTEGDPLELTMDERVQRVAESALASLPRSVGDSALVAFQGYFDKGDNRSLAQLELARVHAADQSCAELVSSIIRRA